MKIPVRRISALPVVESGVLFPLKEKEQAEVGQSPTCLPATQGKPLLSILRVYFTALKALKEQKRYT
ncbi:hypothetical protein AAKU52_000925 [Pedobacter sp. CG_S7]|uniref:hypothetical protein n=1 Tax=Pedobacter sp. CG_S7 TaxID=3143930 RepID=UPI00339340D3